MTAGPGDVIAGKYAIVKVLGAGGMGTVFEATHIKLRQRVALKMLLPEMLEHQIILERFEREARAAAQLRNRHTARVMDVDVTTEGVPYIVMEFLEGHDLNTELERKERLAPEEAVDYVLQACSAMIEAHQHGIVHRDLKPANLFLAVDGDVPIVKVLDFGVSKIQSEAGDVKLTSPESVMGTAHYMSPEQLRASGEVDARTDIWALGIILYELMAGRPPFTGTPTQLAAAIVTEDAPDLRTLCQVPVEIASIVTKALQRDPDQRFADMRQLALALAPFAPASGAGRIIAEGLLSSPVSAPGSSGSFPRMSSQPRLEDAKTVIQAPPISESQPRGEGTAPGWSQHSTQRSRGRTVVVGFVLAFVGALLVIALFAFVWLRFGGGGAAERAAAVQTPSSATTPASATVEPAPAVVEPSPPPAHVASVASAAPSQTAPLKGARTTPPVARPGTASVPIAKPAEPKPSPKSSANPLLL